jgi:hypothetical protein
MQHRWYSGFDWDAHLEKKLKAPLRPKTKEILSEESVASESQVSSKESGSTPSFKLAATSLTRPAQRQGNFINSQRNINAPAKSRISYSLGQGNRHHKKLLEMMSGEGNDSDRHLDTVRMTMMRVIKQSETWSKSSDVSTNGNDSTRNTTLCVGGLEQQYYRRKSESTEDDVSVSSNMLGDNLDAFLRLQLMNLSMATKRNSQVSSGGTAFQQFSLLSIRPSTFAVEELHDNGYRYLDPFSTKCIDLTDQYPSSSSESDVDTEALAAFCFPNGLRVRMIPRCAEEGARRIGWLGRNGDNYQLQGFTDVAGSLSHGIAITVNEEIVAADASRLSSYIALRRERRRSAVVLARWWRQILKLGSRSHHRTNSSSIFGMISAERSNSLRDNRPEKSNSVTVSKGTYKWKRMSETDRIPNARRTTIGDSNQSGNNHSFRAAVDRMMSRNKPPSKRDQLKSASVGDITYESDQSEEYGNGSGGFIIGDAESPLFPEHVRRQGIAAYQAMIDAEKEDDICIVERSYVLTGTPLQDQSLFFCALQNLIDMERECNSHIKEKVAKMNTIKRRSVFSDKDEDDDQNQQQGSEFKYAFNSDNRQAVLSTLQSKLTLNPSQKRVAYPRSEMAHVQNQQRRFEMDLSIMGFDKISLPLPLPEVSGQWGLAKLFLRIKDSGLIILLKLLLLERSVLVVGTNTEEVTSCATALLEMLDPYKWASAFMPLLPVEMLDFVSSPVPFIAGMLVENKQHLNSIVHDHGVKDAMLHGLSIVNLVTGKLIVTREQGTSDMLRRSFQTIPELTLYQKRLEEYCRSPSSNLRSFQSFFRNGASPKESLTLCKIKNVIKRHLSQFTMALTDRPDAWQQYGEFNEATRTFDFCPDRFIQPLKDRMIFQIQFQEMMAHTQLFVGYVEELQRAHEKRSDLLAGPAAQYIFRWVKLRWHARKLSDNPFLESN